MCSREHEILAAGGLLSPELAAHLRGCEDCAATAAIANYLAAEAAGDPPPPQSASLLLWRAKLDERRRVAGRSALPVRIMEWTGAAAVVAIPLALAIASGSALAIGTAVGGVLLLAPAGAALLYWSRRG